MNKSVYYNISLVDDGTRFERQDNKMTVNTSARVASLHE